MLTPKRIFLIFSLVLLAFIGLYTWDTRTGYPTKVAQNTGLEIVGYIIAPGVWVKEQVSDLWSRYVALVGVAEENARLREELDATQAELLLAREESGELERLRELMQIPPLSPWVAVGARVLSGRFGPKAGLESAILNKGFTGGVSSGVPVVNRYGLVGRIYRIAPHSSSLMLVTDPGFRVAVFSQSHRASGILSGGGTGMPLEVHYVDPNAELEVGELLVSSGLDGYMPKGIPVARITSIEPSQESMFRRVTAEPLVSLDNLEEVTLLLPPVESLANVQDFRRLPVPAVPAPEAGAPGQ